MLDMRHVGFTLACRGLANQLRLCSFLWHSTVPLGIGGRPCLPSWYGAGRSPRGTACQFTPSSISPSVHLHLETEPGLKNIRHGTDLVIKSEGQRQEFVSNRESANKKSVIKTALYTIVRNDTVDSISKRKHDENKALPSKQYFSWIQINKLYFITLAVGAPTRFTKESIVCIHTPCQAYPCYKRFKSHGKFVYRPLWNCSRFLKCFCKN